MQQHALCVGLILTTVLVLGCQPAGKTAPPPQGLETEVTAHGPPSRARTEAERVRDYALAIQNSRDRIEEAAAIQRLNDYLAERQLTFNVTGERALDYARVRSLSSSSDQLRVRMDVYRGQQPIQSFTFTPRDNRNLTLIGQ